MEYESNWSDAFQFFNFFVLSLSSEADVSLKLNFNFDVKLGGSSSIITN